MKKSKHSLAKCGLSDGTQGQPFGSCDGSCETKEEYTKRKVLFRIEIDTAFYAKSEKQKKNVYQTDSDIHKGMLRK